MNRIELKAYAKVNLTLEVLGKRTDGYHEVQSVLQTIDLADRLSIEAAEEVSLEVLPDEVGPQEENLALQAARLLQRHTCHREGAHMRLEKEIPVAAGLGGGSADAAAALHGLNQLWSLGLSLEDLHSLGAQLGTDVPFLLSMGTALGEGRGEVVRSLPPLSERWVVLLRPPLELEGKTRRLYGLLTPHNYSDGGITQRLVEHLRWGEAPEELFYNVFDQVVERVFPGIGDYRTVFLDAGAPWVQLSGSGPALFTFLSDSLRAQATCQHLQGKGFKTYLCKTINPRMGA